jgi:hypothetical protein
MAVRLESIYLANHQKGKVTGWDEMRVMLAGK